MTEAMAAITYASIMSRETVRISLMIATLINLEVKVGKILMIMYRHGPLWVLSLVKMQEKLQ